MRTIQNLSAVAGIALTLVLLALSLIPDYVGIGYISIIAAPYFIN